nr:UBN2 domain-containing protein [Tanacetum cinerariifolium]
MDSFEGSAMEKEEEKGEFGLGGKKYTVHMHSNNQVKDNKIDLLVQQYEKITILKEESIHSGFGRLDTIITSLKALGEGFFSKNYVRKFLRALHPKWRAKVTVIEESKDLSSLALDELMGNLKVHEVVMEKDSEIYRGKKERVKPIALKAKKESSDDETLTSRSDNEEYAIAKGKSDHKYFRCDDPNHLIGDCPKPSRNKNQKAIIRGSWSDSENDTEDKTNDEICLMAQSLNLLGNQDVKTNLFWEFGKFTSHDEESMESYYSRIAKIANPLALVAAAQQYPDNYYPVPKPQRSYAPASKHCFSTRSNATIRHKGKEIAKPVTPPSESEFDKYSDPKQAQKIKKCKRIWLSLLSILKSFTNLPIKTFELLQTPGTSMQSSSAADWDTVYYWKKFRHFAKECKKPKWVKDYTYHKENMFLCKQAEKGVPLQAEQADWLEDMDEEVDDQELEAHYHYMAKIQEVLDADSDTTAEPLIEVQYNDDYNVFGNDKQYSEQSKPIMNTCVVEMVDSNIIPDSPDMCDNDDKTDQNTKECDDERVALANLIANLTLDTEENKKILKQLKKANASLTHELEKCQINLEETTRALGETTSS